MKKISIVTICYNASNTIEETIKSVASQKTEEVEYIIVDGESQDNTLEIVNSYSSFIDKIIIEKDQGISDAFNKGIKAASGKVIGLLNADDVMVDGAISKLLSCVDDYTDVYRCNINVWNSKTGEKKVLVPSMDMIPHGQRMVVAHAGTYIRKDAYEKYGLYDIKCRVKMDEDLLIRFAKKGAKVKYLPFSSVNFRTGGVSTRKEKTLSKLKSSLKETFYIYNKNDICLVAKLREIIRLTMRFILA